MSKTSNKQRVEQLDSWIKFMMYSSPKFREMKKKKRKPQYMLSNDNDI